MGELCLLGIREDLPGAPRSGVQETGWHILTYLKYPLCIAYNDVNVTSIILHAVVYGGACVWC